MYASHESSNYDVALLYMSFSYNVVILSITTYSPAYRVYSREALWRKLAICMWPYGRCVHWYGSRCADVCGQISRSCTTEQQLTAKLRYQVHHLEVKYSPRESVPLYLPHRNVRIAQTLHQNIRVPSSSSVKLCQWATMWSYPFPLKLTADQVSGLKPTGKRWPFSKVWLRSFFLQRVGTDDRVFGILSKHRASHCMKCSWSVCTLSPLSPPLYRAVRSASVIY